MNLKQFAISAAATAAIVGTIGLAYAQTDTKNRNPDGTSIDTPQAAPAAGTTGPASTMPGNSGTMPSTPGTTMPGTSGTMPSTPGTTMPGTSGTMPSTAGTTPSTPSTMSNSSGSMGTERAARADRN